jgi:hypothetical protein
MRYSMYHIHLNGADSYAFISLPKRFGTDSDLRICTTELRTRIRFLLLSSVDIKWPELTKVFLIFALTSSHVMDARYTYVR